MGKGDKKTKRGKLILGSYGVRRRRKQGGKLVKPTDEVIEMPAVEKEVAPKPKPQSKTTKEKTAEAKAKASTAAKKKEEK